MSLKSWRNDKEIERDEKKFTCDLIFNALFINHLLFIMIYPSILYSINLFYLALRACLNEMFKFLKCNVLPTYLTNMEKEEKKGERGKRDRETYLDHI